jgi:hypothetical protein
MFYKNNMHSIPNQKKYTIDLKGFKNSKRYKQKKIVKKFNPIANQFHFTIEMYIKMQITLSIGKHLT